VTSEREFTFPSARKDSADEKKVELNLFKYCANYWRANELVEIGEYFRPTKSTGFAYQVSTGGTTGAREPKWPETSGATVISGSATFTCVPAGSNGLNALSSPSVVSDPTGMTISSVSVSESTKLLATYQGGTLGQDYDAVFTFTLNGITRVARQKVLIRKR
jgi:hypothetical protein